MAPDDRTSGKSPGSSSHTVRTSAGPGSLTRPAGVEDPIIVKSPVVSVPAGVTSTVISAVTQSTGSEGTTKAADPPDALTALAIDTAVPNSKVALKQLLISVGLMSAIAIGQVVVEVIPKISEHAAPLLPPTLSWLPGVVTTGGASLAAWLAYLAKKNHVTSVKDALYTDTQRKFYIPSDKESP